VARGILTFAVLCFVVAAAAVTSGASRLAAHERGCTADSTTRLVYGFVASFNRGKVEAAVGVWAPAPRFQWYSTSRPGKRLGSSSMDRSTLASYFRSRARMHEKIQLIQFGAGYDPKRDIVDFGGKLIRRADDASRTPRQRDFKGAADCRSGHPSLIVWSTT
jgi:hypothetical protein